jgi:hypothetical protein
MQGGHRIAGVVLGPDGNPVANAGVGASPESDGRSFRMRMPGMGGEGTIYSGTDGTFTIDDLDKGTYTVSATHAGFPDAEVKGIVADTLAVRVQFRAEALVAGTVVGSDGKAISDYQIIAMSTSGDGTDRIMKSFMGGQSLQSVHDPSGAFEIHSLAAGSYDLVVTTSDGHAGKLGPLSVAEGEQKRGVKVTVNEGAQVKGRVVENESGAPVAGAQLVIGATGQPMMQKSDDQGNFKIDGLPPGRPVTIFASVGVPFMDGSKLLPDSREVTVGDGSDATDAGTIRLIKGDMTNRPDGTTGITPFNRDGKAFVQALRDGSAAAKAGLKVGDFLVSIDGRDVTQLGPLAISFYLGGAVGSEVKIGVSSVAGGGARVVTITRTQRPAGSM